jgi:AP-3 complex subunit beta
VSNFFPDVVKNVASVSLEVRKLVYIYLLRYAEQEQDLALLSINTFQKDLNDTNQLIRAMALRVMSGFRVSVITTIILLAVKKCVRDMSPYVRKTAAHAISKIYRFVPGRLLTIAMETRRDDILRGSSPDLPYRFCLIPCNSSRFPSAWTRIKRTI